MRTAAAQTSVLDAPWTGWVQCVLEENVTVTFADNPAGQPSFAGLYVLTLQIARVGTGAAVAP